MLQNKEKTYEIKKNHTSYSENKFLIGLCVCLILLLLSPVILFHKDIVFDKITFINNWLLCIGQGGVIAIILNIAMLRYKKIIQNKQDANIIFNIVQMLHDTATEIEQCKYNKLIILERFKYIENSYVYLHDFNKKINIHKIITGEDFIDCRTQLTNAQAINKGQYILNLISNITNNFKNIKI